MTSQPIGEPWPYPSVNINCPNDISAVKVDWGIPPQVVFNSDSITINLNDAERLVKQYEELKKINHNEVSVIYGAEKFYVQTLEAVEKDLIKITCFNKKYVTLLTHYSNIQLLSEKRERRTNGYCRD